LANTDEGGNKARLTAYCEALEGCELIDLRRVVADLLAGRPAPRKWAPSAPELAQAVRDAKARREWDPSKTLELAGANASGDCQPTDQERERMCAKWQKVGETFGATQNPADWIRERIADGTIRNAR